MNGLTRWALASSILILLFLAVRFLLRNRLNLRVRYALWLVVAARLLVPVQMPFRLPFVLPEQENQMQVDVIAPAELAPFDETSEDVAVLVPGTDTGVVEEFSLTEGSVYSIQGADEANVEIVPYPGTSGDVWYLLGDQATLVTQEPDLLPLVWLAGVILVLGTVLVSNLRFSRRLRRVCRPLPVDGFPLPVRVASHLDSPCLAGIFWPVVYLTPETAADEAAMRHVLAHELTHYNHRDHLWSVLRCLCLALHWYNPLVWLCAILSRRDAELACDEGAVELLGEGERIPYGRTLVDMVARRSGFGDLFCCSTAMSAGRGMRQRVQTLIRHPRTAVTALITAVAVLFGGLMAVFAEGTTVPVRDFRSFTRELKRAEQVEIITYHEPVMDLVVTEEEQLAEIKQLLSGGTELGDEAPEPGAMVPGDYVVRLDDGDLWYVMDGRLAYLDTEKQKVVALAQLPSEASLENLLEIAGDTDRAGRVRDPGASVVANCPGYPTESLELTLLGQSVTNSGDVLVIVKDTAGQQEGRCNGFVGLVNPTSWGPVGRTWLCRGDRFEFATWEDGATGVLIVGSNLWIGENGEETGTAPLLLKQSASGLTRITRLPPSARTCGLELPSDEDFFTEGSPYWEDHRIAPIDGGFLLLERSGEGWQEMGFVPVSLAEPYAAPVAECWYDEEQLGHAAGEWYWMKEYPGWSFLVKDGSLTLRNGLEVFWEQDHLRNLYASDLDGDGTAELCMTVSEADSSWIQVVSLKDGDLPCISLVGNMDWTLVVEEGALRVRGSLDGVSFTGVPVLENGKLTVKIPQPNGGTLIADLTEEAEAEMAPQSGHQEVTWEVSGNSSDTGIFSIGKSGTT